MEFPDDLVAPRVRSEVENQRVPAPGVSDRGALVARGREQIRPRGQGRQVLVVLHAAPGDQEVRVRGVDGVRAGAHVAC